MKSIPFKLLPVAAAVGAVASAAIAAPPAPQVLQGTASVSTAGSVQTITHSANAVLNFRSFNVLAGETVRFVQPNAASTVLNRVLGGGVNIGGTVDSNGRVLFQMNGVVTASGFSLDLGATAVSSLKLGAPLAPRTALAPVVLHGDEVLASLAQGRVLVFAGEGARTAVAASPTGEVVVPPGGSVELADIAWPNIRVEVRAPSDRPLNVSRLLARNAVTGVFGGLFAGPKARVRTGSDEPVMVAFEAFPGPTAGRYASPSLGTMRFIESALREIALGRTLAPASTSSEQPATALAGAARPLADEGTREKETVPAPVLAAAREEIVVASIPSTQVAAVPDTPAALRTGEMSIAGAEPALPVAAGIGELIIAAAEPAAPAAVQISEMNIAAAEPAASVAAEISEMSIAAAQLAVPAIVQVSEMNIAAGVPVEQDPAQINEMSIAAAVPVEPEPARISEASIAAAEPAAAVAVQVSEMNIAAAVPVEPDPAQINEMSIAAVVPAEPEAVQISEASLAAALPSLSAPVQVAAKPVIVLAAAQASSMPAPKVLAASVPVATALPQRAAPAAATISSEPVSAVAEMVADLPLTKRDVWGDSDSTKVAQAAQPRLPAFVMDQKGGIFYL